MDDVGQTLLNWASAFGTQEMVKKNKRPPAEKPKLSREICFVTFVVTNFFL